MASVQSRYDDMIARQQQIVDGYDGKVTVDLNDSRLTSIEAERQKAISENNSTYKNLVNQSNQSYGNLINQSNQSYDNLINQSNQYYNNMINGTSQYYENINKTMEEGYQKQSQAQQAQLQETIANINTQKERTERDYQREQRGAYTDYQNQINPYGVQAEQMASNGLNNTGYSESSRTSMYNAYQNRVATARQSLQDALVDYNAQIVSAQNTNSVAMAELWSNVYLKMAENALAGFQYKNELEQSKLNAVQSLTQNKLSASQSLTQNQLSAYQTLTQNRINNENTLQSRYDTRYQNMLGQINQEISNKQSQYNTALSILQSDRKLNEDIKQFNEQMAYQRERAKVQDAQWQQEYNLSLQKYRASLSSSSGSTRSVSGTKNVKSTTPSSQDILKNMKIIQGPGIKNNIKDGYSGKTFSSPKALLAYYGYGVS